jgi:GTP cyclohydrolase IA
MGRIAESVVEILSSIGEDASRDGLLKTPTRVEQAFMELTAGYRGPTVVEILNGAYFDVTYDEMVVVKNIEFYSLCEHHMLPFFGKMHVAYLPKDKVVGLSKIPRLVDLFARRLQVQERLTQDVAGCIQMYLDPRGVGVVCQAQHFCMMMRGVQKQCSDTVTSAMTGVFRDNPATRAEFLSLVK